MEALLQAHAADILLLGGQEEAHGRPGNDAEPLAIQQMNDDRNLHDADSDAESREGRFENEAEKGQDLLHYHFRKRPLFERNDYVGGLHGPAPSLSRGGIRTDLRLVHILK